MRSRFQTVVSAQAALLVSVVLLFSGAADAQDSATDRDKLRAERIQRMENGLLPLIRIDGEPALKFNLTERLKEYNIPGLSVAVVHEGKLEWVQGYGLADVGEGRKVDENTLFLAGSISKPVAALRIHQLSEQRIVDLDANVNNYLTSWQVPDNEFTTNEKVTLRRILNHTAGLTVWGFPGYDKGDEIPSVVGVLDGEGNTDPVRVFREPGKAWLYSGGGYTIMQLLTSDVEKASYPEVLQKNVLSPLGMTESTFENPLPEKYHAIAATGYRANGDEVAGKWPVYPEMAAAGLWTKPSQLIQYAVEIQRIVESKQDGILKHATVVEMLKPGMNGHGLGPTTTAHTFGHGGADRGFRAQLVAWKGTRTAAVVMVNSDNGQIIPEVVRAIAAEYGLPGSDQRVKKVKALSAAELAKFAGTYRSSIGELSVSVKDKGLEVLAGDSPRFFLPESENRFFRRESGRTIVFQVENGSVSGFKVNGTNIEAEKVDEPN